MRGIVQSLATVPLTFMVLSAWLFAGRAPGVAAQSGVFCGVVQGTCEPGTLAGAPLSCPFCECDTDGSGQATDDCGRCSTTTLGGETMAAELNCQGFGDWGRAKPNHNGIECAGNVCTPEDCCETPPTCTADFQCESDSFVKANPTNITCTLGGDGTDDACTADECCTSCTTIANSDATTLTCTTSADSQVTTCATGFNLCESGGIDPCADGTTPNALADTCVPNPTCGNIDDDDDGGSEDDDAFDCPAGFVLKSEPLTISCASGTCTSDDCCDAAPVLPAEVSTSGAVGMLHVSTAALGLAMAAAVLWQ